MRQYKYITFNDRKQIAEWYKSGDRVADIAARLGMTTKAIYSELKRGESMDNNGDIVLDQNWRHAYDPVIAQQIVQENFKRRGRRATSVMKGG